MVDVLQPLRTISRRSRPRELIMGTKMSAETTCSPLDEFPFSPTKRSVCSPCTCADSRNQTMKANDVVATRNTYRYTPFAQEEPRFAVRKGRVEVVNARIVESLACKSGLCDKQSRD